MGGAASIPADIDSKLAEDLTGSAFDLERFEKAAGGSGKTISKDQLLQAFIERERLINAFKQIDTDDSGSIDAEELKELLVSLDVDASKADELMAAIDSDNSGTIELTEWLKHVKLGGASAFEKMLSAKMDSSGRIKGFVSLDELFQKRKTVCKKIKAALSAIDDDEVAAPLKAELAKTQGQLEVLAAKIKATAVSEEKQLFRLFRSIDTDRSGFIDTAELTAALEAMSMDICDTGDLMKSCADGADTMTFRQFCDAVKKSGGHAFHKALDAEVREGGEKVTFSSLEAQLEKRKAQVLELEKSLEASPDDAGLKDALSKRKSQGEALAAKLKAIAADDNRKIKEIFMQIDTDDSGTIDVEELAEACKALDLSGLKAESLIESIVGDGKTKEITFDQFKDAVKLGGGRSFEKALASKIGPDGKIKGFVTLDELYQKRKAQCIAIKAALRSGQDVDKAMLEAKLAKRVGMLEVLSAKIKAQAISEEKKLYRLFKQMDSDGSGTISLDELETACDALRLEFVDIGSVMKELGGTDGTLDFKTFKAALLSGGGKRFGKALGAAVMHDGEVASFFSLEQELTKRKEQLAAVQAQLEKDPDSAEYQAAFKKRKGQGEAVAAKLKALASNENKILKDAFDAIDADGGGTISKEELIAAVKKLDLDVSNPLPFLKELDAGTEITFDMFKEKINLAGGRSFEKALYRRVTPAGDFFIAKPDAKPE
jgi:Ca2+-binding EF-hand superfamily protein